MPNTQTSARSHPLAQAVLNHTPNPNNTDPRMLALFDRCWLTLQLMNHLGLTQDAAMDAVHDDGQSATVNGRSYTLNSFTQEN